jgi:hypothetical protein
MDKRVRYCCSTLTISLGLTGLAATAEAAPADEIAAAVANGEVVDLTVTVADN